MSKLLLTLPPKEKIELKGATLWSKWRKTEWPIKTFITQQEKNINIAINYYYQKASSFITASSNKVFNDFSATKVENLTT
jgi:hypothetical protein